MENERYQRHDLSDLRLTKVRLRTNTYNLHVIELPSSVQSTRSSRAFARLQTISYRYRVNSKSSRNGCRHGCTSGRKIWIIFTARATSSAEAKLPCYTRRALSCATFTFVLFSRSVGRVIGIPKIANLCENIKNTPVRCA
jgi:hypothetical protein